MNRSLFPGAPARLFGLGLALLMAGAPALADLTPRVLHRFDAASAGAGANPHLPPVYRPGEGALLGVTPLGGAATSGAYYQLRDAQGSEYQAAAFAEAGGLGLRTGLVVDSQGQAYVGSTPFLGAPGMFRWAAGGVPSNALAGTPPDGSEDAFKPRGLFAVDADDNVYFGGGSGRAGNGLFRLDAAGALTWLVDFQLPDYVQGSGNPQTVYLKGQYPVALAVDDDADMLYGINVRDQSAGAGDESAVPEGDETAGTLFSVDLSQAVGEGATPVTVLHTFAKNAEGEIKGNDSGQQALVHDGDWLYGTTTLGVWRYHLDDEDSFTVLHRFGDGEDGQTPWGPLVLAEDGHVYGTTRRTSAGGAGALYRIRIGAADDRADDGYELLHLFDVESDGAFPNGLSAGPVNDGIQTLYGATNAGGAPGDTVSSSSATGSGTVYALDVAPPVAANIDIQAQPTTLTEGESTILTWSVSGADQCVGEGEWGGNKALQGSETLTPDVAGEFTYTLTCVDGDSETVSASATVTVNASGSEGGEESGGGGGGGSVHYLMLLALAALLGRRTA
ncbi:choice-of-anchor tandem repeat GloVer-containing protein [Alloalcanivorax mobilis]|uniref:choice-of-anchor tandem repeat GloVer-containing protein n=1 Tax=Alloalcanivorax mobilis TaxID=2019569 RepID=UPI000C78CF58|nr:choice-of-anchor tandem repeat GloVer-containing protein [Alloalcanivorax mobilis]